MLCIQHFYLYSRCQLSTLRNIIFDKILDNKLKIVEFITIFYYKVATNWFDKKKNEKKNVSVDLIYHVGHNI